MALKFSNALRSTRAQAVVTACDAGSGAAVLQVRSGTQPAGPDTAAAGTLLASITLNDPSFAESGAVLTIDSDPAIADSSADNTGTASWFRILTSAGTAVVDGSVTATGGGGDLTLNTVSIVSGASVTITGGTITEAA
jgi:hypothetical protein